MLYIKKSSTHDWLKSLQIFTYDAINFTNIYFVTLEVKRPLCFAARIVEKMVQPVCFSTLKRNIFLDCKKHIKLRIRKSNYEKNV